MQINDSKLYCFLFLNIGFNFDSSVSSQQSKFEFFTFCFCFWCSLFRSDRSPVFYKKVVPKNFTKFWGKHMSRGLSKRYSDSGIFLRNVQSFTEQLFLQINYVRLLPPFLKSNIACVDLRIFGQTWISRIWRVYI